MKTYLLTWYGLTDLRAALGLSNGGPVLSAILAENYTEVILLGYTNAEKVSPTDFSEIQNIITRREQARHVNDSEIFSAVNSFANTEEAHSAYLNWLKAKLAQNGKETVLNFESVSLKDLNDTDGIYQTATRSLSMIDRSDDEKRVTLYLSPGTPVMAFVWAFAALRHPKLKKRLLVSSKPGLPPETIALPGEWEQWYGKQVHRDEHTKKEYDIIFHLFGEQRMPSLLGIHQFKRSKHVFIKSDAYPAEVMKQFLEKDKFYQICVDAFDPESVRTEVLKYLENVPNDTNIGFNLTGGTKLMYAGALNACRMMNATPFYFSSHKNQIINLNDFERKDTEDIKSVETFIQLNGDKLLISKSGLAKEIKGFSDPKRKQLTEKLWFKKGPISRLYRGLSKFNDNPGEKFSIEKSKISASLKSGKHGTVVFQERGGVSKYEFPEWPYFARYLSGGWFEEYIYRKLQPLVYKGLIYDLRIGFEVAFKDSSSPDSGTKKGLREQLRDKFGDSYQELDISFTDGKRLYIVECKAGSVKGAYIRKLESITRYFGGKEGIGIMACCFMPNSKVVQQKAINSPNVKLLAGNNLVYNIEQFIRKMNQ